MENLDAPPGHGPHELRRAQKAADAAYGLARRSWVAAIGGGALFLLEFATGSSWPFFLAMAVWCSGAVMASMAIRQSAKANRTYRKYPAHATDYGEAKSSGAMGLAVVYLVAFVFCCGPFLFLFIAAFGFVVSSP